ncbi:MAG: succinylglutamate desuccinylase/aspartoacylase family protein [Xanthomonadales bacterium]|nr:succinylglutamate desuccinylase/aspartoacylase family protein [Xanthomonadales bacterium]
MTMAPWLGFAGAGSLALALIAVVPTVGTQESGPFVGPPALLPAGNPDSSEFIGPKLVGNFELLGATVAPGTTKRLTWNASTGLVGSELGAPVLVAHGARPGPVLCLIAGVHGDELNSVEIVRRVSNAVDPADFGGTLVSIPVVNLFGYLRNSRYLPDRRDLNRYFPGSAHGSIASRIAYSLFNEVIRHCGAVVDLHTGSFDRRNLPQVRADLSRPDVAILARGFGATAVLHSRGSRGMLRYAAIEAGIPAVTLEVGGPAELEPDEIEHGEQALNTLLHELGMTRHLPSWNETPPVFYASSWIRSDAGGLLLSHVELGEHVTKGQVLGEVIDPISNNERKLVSPSDGTIIGLARNQVVLPGFAVFHLGGETSEQNIVREARRGDPGVIDEDGLRAGEGGDPDEESEEMELE